MSHSLQPFRRLTRHLTIERPIIFTIIIYSIAIGLLSLAFPIATQSLVNTIAFGNIYQPIVILTIIVAIVLIFAALLQSLRVWVVEVLQQRLFVRVASDTVNRLLRARGDAFAEQHGPELVNRFFDVVTLQKAAASLLIDGLTIVMQSTIGLVLLALYHPWLLAFDLFLLAAILFIIFPLGRGAITTAVNESRAKYEVVAWFEEVARHPITFKSPDAAGLAIARADTLTGEYLKHRKRHFRILFRQVLGSYALHAIASATLLGVGGFLVINRQLTLGQLVAAELVVEIVVIGFSKLGKHLESYYDLLAAMDKLGYIEDLPLEPNPIIPTPSLSMAPAEAALRSVSLSYGVKPVFLNTSMEVRSGLCIGLSGWSGNGKSTLLDLFYGMREPDTGAIEIDSIDVREWDRAKLRQQVMLIRSVEIFEGTILDNLQLGNQGVDLMEIRWALDQVGLLADIQAMPEGLATRLSTGGRPLSEGQAMRLVFARALVRRPRLLLIDEALDSIKDAPGTDVLMESLFSKDKPWTLIVASASPDLLSRCDVIYEIQDLQVVKV
jgi:ABC-type bacteriocin/lantibiotic exporter with double-glycine peptidase domain